MAFNICSNCFNSTLQNISTILRQISKILVPGFAYLNFIPSNYIAFILIPFILGKAPCLAFFMYSKTIFNFHQNYSECSLPLLLFLCFFYTLSCCCFFFVYTLNFFHPHFPPPHNLSLMCVFSHTQPFVFHHSPSILFHTSH